MKPLSYLSSKFHQVKQESGSTDGIIVWETLLQSLVRFDYDTFLIPHAEVFGKHLLHELKIDSIPYGNPDMDSVILTRGTLVNSLFRAKVRGKRVTALVLLSTISAYLSDSSLRTLIKFAQTHSIPLIVEDGVLRPMVAQVLADMQLGSVPLVWVSSDGIESA